MKHVNTLLRSDNTKLHQSSSYAHELRFVSNVNVSKLGSRIFFQAKSFSDSFNFGLQEIIQERISSFFEPVQKDFCFNFCRTILLFADDNVLQSLFNVFIKNFILFWTKNLVQIRNNEVSFCGIVRNKNSTNAFVLE